MKTIGITRMPANHIGDTDRDVLFSEEILKLIPGVAKHWDEYNNKNLWSKERYHNEKYAAVACIGDPYDYSYEEVGWTNRWKEARKMHAMGADIYSGSGRIYFVDHEAVQEAYNDLLFDEIVGLDMVSDSALAADVRRKSAYDTLEQNGLKADKEWRIKIIERHDPAFSTYDKLSTPFYKRKNCEIEIDKDGNIIKVLPPVPEQDEIPF